MNIVSPPTKVGLNVHPSPSDEGCDKNLVVDQTPKRASVGDGCEDVEAASLSKDWSTEEDECSVFSGKRTGDLLTSPCKRGSYQREGEGLFPGSAVHVAPPEDNIKCKVRPVHLDQQTLVGSGPQENVSGACLNGVPAAEEASHELHPTNESTGEAWAGQDCNNK